MVYWLEKCQYNFRSTDTFFPLPFFFFFCFGRKDLQYVWASFLRHTLKLKSSIFIFCFRRCIWICLFFLNYEIPIVLIMCWYLPKLYLLSTILSVRLVFSNCFFLFFTRCILTCKCFMDEKGFSDWCLFTHEKHLKISHGMDVLNRNQ